MNRHRLTVLIFLQEYNYYSPLSLTVTATVTRDIMYLVSHSTLRPLSLTKQRMHASTASGTLESLPSCTPSRLEYTCCLRFPRSRAPARYSLVRPPIFASCQALWPSHPQLAVVPRGRCRFPHSCFDFDFDSDSDNSESCRPQIKLKLSLFRQTR